MVLEPLESAFIVFRKDAKAAEGTVNYPEHEQIADLSKATWNITFDADRKGPQPMTVDSLFDWSTQADKDFANYSGNAVYTTEFNLAALPEGKTYVDLGKVMVMAKVKVNGEYAGGVWTNPYRLDITPATQRR